jgi:hypothetical protein
VGRRALLAALLGAGALACARKLRAHPGHGDEISRDQAVQRATTEVERLAEQGKIEKSWRIEARLESAETADRSSGQEWVVVFGNAKAPAPQSKLYVFLSLTGEYLAANFTGR